MGSCPPPQQGRGLAGRGAEKRTAPLLLCPPQPHLAVIAIIVLLLLLVVVILLLLLVARELGR